MKITFLQKINPCFWIGNIDDPLPPADYHPNYPKWKRSLYWRIRNPLHNFTFYVIGIADKPFTSVGRHPNHVFNPDSGWNWAIRKYKILRLPFVSYINGIKFYAGWRERGNAGIKLTKNG